MATFRVNQRVKKIANIRREDVIQRPSRPKEIPIGSIGTIIDFNERGPVVLYDDAAFHSDSPSGGWTVRTYMIVPLTDPKADEFIESIKKLSSPTKNPRWKRSKHECEAAPSGGSRGEAETGIQS